MVEPNPTAPLERHLDLTLARANAGHADVERLCERARVLQAAAVCVPGAWVGLARARLEVSGVKVSALISFPLGQMAGDAKRYEIEAAVDDGAQEVDVVVNHALLADGQERAFKQEARDLAEAAGGRPVKLIVEPALLSREVLLRAAWLCAEAEVHCLGVATGLAERGALEEEVRFLADTAAGALFFKATVTPADRGMAQKVIAAGALRVGLLEGF